VSLEFLSPGAAEGGAVARSPMQRATLSAGARLEVRDGWSVAVAYGPLADEQLACSESAGWTDASHLGKVELQADAGDLAAIVERAGGPAALELGSATRAGETWWCPVNPGRVLAICPPAETTALLARLREATAAAAHSAHVADLSTAYAALVLSGPLARELFARFCALDLRPDVTPVGAFRPGSVARTPGLVLREAEDRYLALVGAALGEYLWTVVEDAGRHLGGRPVGLDALSAAPEEEPAHA
jgi:heterotetrameric sarcosine oxidase gamma subunit